MKKSLKSELVSIAHKILQLKDDASYHKMAQEAGAVYEKLTILAYAEKLEQSGKPTIGLALVEEAMSELETIEGPTLEDEKAVPMTPSQIAAANKEKFEEARATDEHRPDGTLFNEEEPVHEPVIEKIKDMVAEMPPEAAVIDELVDSIEPKSFQKNDMFDIGGEYAQTPIFDPIATQEDEKPKNLNESLKTGLKVGLNDKLAFVKHLFAGSDPDYTRVLSQLETFSTREKAEAFIVQMVKPDYNNWEGKEEYEDRFMQVLANKFE